MEEEALQFVEGEPCPINVSGTGGGLSFSPAGDMLLIGTFPNPSPAQIEAWSGKWRAKLISESEFPVIPIFAVGGEDWLLETPCNPAQQEKETPGFSEALFAKENHSMGAILVDAETSIIKKVRQVELEEMFIERLVLSWNPFRFPSDDYTKSFSDEQFVERITKIFSGRSAGELWKTSW